MTISNRGTTVPPSEDRPAPGPRERASTSGWVDVAFRFPTRYRIVWIALAGLIVVCAILSPATLSPASLKLVTALGAVLAIASAGQLLTIMLRGIDLSVPAVMTAAAAIVVARTNGDNGRLAFAIVLALALGAVVGIVNGFLVAVLKLNAIIVTLAIGGIVSGILLLVVGGTWSPSGRVPQALIDLTQVSFGPINALLVVAVVLLVILGAVLRRTRAGRRFVSTGTNPGAAHLLGVRTTGAEWSAYAIAGVLYAVAGILLAGILQSPNSTLGSDYQLTPIVVVALGGASLGGGPASVLSTGAAAIFLVLLDQVFLTQHISGGIQVLVHGVVLVLAIGLVVLLGDGGPRNGLRRIRGMVHRR